MKPIEKFKNIGILMSGGFDSALLLHLICNVNDNSHIKIFTIDKPDGSMFHVSNLLRFNNFRTNTYERIIVPGGDGDEVNDLGITGRIAFGYIRDNYLSSLDVLYSGNTKNPPVFLESTTKEPDRSTANKAEQKYDNFVMPFSEHSKDFTVKMVDDLKLYYIIRWSHTCTEQLEGRCFQCWQCKERQWAFETAGLKDYGTR